MYRKKINEGGACRLIRNDVSVYRHINFQSGFFFLVFFFLFLLDTNFFPSCRFGSFFAFFSTLFSSSLPRAGKQPPRPPARSFFTVLEIEEEKKAVQQNKNGENVM